MIGNGVRTIGDYAFYRCSGAVSLTIGENVQSIGDYAFTHGSSVTSLKLPESVKEIGKCAFLGCAALTSVRLPEGVESIGDYAFTSLNDATFYTPADKEENGWGEVWNASFRPVFWNCVFSDEGYLICFEKTEANVSNFHSAAVFAPPGAGGICIPRLGDFAGFFRGSLYVGTDGRGSGRNGFICYLGAKHLNIQ